MNRWHLPSIDATGKREPRVLFSRPACRGVVLDLQAGDEMRAHQVHENAVLEVVTGTVAIEVDGRAVECEAGTLVVFDPNERHSVRAVESARILLMLAPWPGQGHYGAGEIADPERLPRGARVAPLDD